MSPRSSSLLIQLRGFLHYFFFFNFFFFAIRSFASSTRPSGRSSLSIVLSVTNRTQCLRPLIDVNSRQTRPRAVEPHGRGSSLIIAKRNSADKPRGIYRSNFTDELRASAKLIRGTCESSMPDRGGYRVPIQRKHLLLQTARGAVFINFFFPRDSSRWEPFEMRTTSFNAGAWHFRTIRMEFFRLALYFAAGQFKSTYASF